jgi:rubrerythrin
MPKTLDDLLEVAIQHEISSQQMYRAAGTIVSDPEAKRFLRGLVEEEEGHERTLRSLREMEIFDGSVPLEDESMLDAGSGSHGEERAPLPADAGIEQVLELALTREHRARTLFEQLAGLARNEELRTLFEKLAAEEDSHHDAIIRRFKMQRGEMGDEM